MTNTATDDDTCAEPTPIRIAVDGDGIATLTLTRVEKRNAMSGAMIDALSEAADDLGRDPAVRAIIIAAAGPVFCAGGDLAWMQAQMAADRAQRIAEAWRLADMLFAINRIPKPVVARVHANSFGGGLGLMAVADHVVAAETAQFAFTETKLGIIPATIGPYVITRMGEGRARRVFMSGRTFGAAEARALGLVEFVVPEAELDATIAAIIAPYLTVSTPAVGAAKHLACDLGGGVTEADITRSVEALADAWESEDAQSRIAAFLKKRARSES